MASATVYLVVNLLHVVSAAVALGYVALLPLWRQAALRAEEPGVLRHALGVMITAQQRIVLPAAVVLATTGLLLVLGPLARTFDLTRSSWAQGATAVGLAFCFILVLGLGGPLRKMMPLVEKGEHTGPAMDKRWADWRTALFAAAVLGLASVYLMITRPGA